MKKQIKAILLAGILAVSVLSLCSCKQLDEAKNNHGIYLDSGKITVGFRGETYTRIETGLENKHYYDSDEAVAGFIQRDTNGVYLTEKNIPVLLKDVYGDRVDYFAGDEVSPVILSVYGYDEDKGSYQTYYCRDDKAEEIKDVLKNKKLDQFFFSYGGWDEYLDNFETITVVLDPQMTDAIHESLDRRFDPETDYKDFWDIPNTDRNYLVVEACDKDQILTDGKPYMIVRTLGTKPSYYVAVSDSKEEQGVPLINVEWRKIPKQETEAFEQLFS
ncbi:MAG: hypothetical protein IKE48_02930, partial [Parasporobacterium sp.]|nr:hypothetical protein [Parasporobacterium sp.]